MRSRVSRWSAGQLGVTVLLVSTTMLFLACAAAVLITRYTTSIWTAPAQPWPWATRLGIALLAGVSVALHLVLRAVRRNRRLEAARLVRVASAASLAFLVCQVLSVSTLLERLQGEAALSLYVFSACLMTGVHGAHVLGGLGLLWWMQARVAAGEYSSSRYAAVRYVVQFWHYLGAMWVLLLAVLKGIS